ncbi:MAG: DUF350 domain-containing protein [Candidatus Gracilibacteria bacterium]|nr:DUF350 domain-containing protein [Candidatus Gracilibacteria bacterium]MDD3120238.1 DUF350 domain-containing protein [Candidatus Gracilibacteria bacterium]MDD4530144.1 DUF350 domain-containing protein [Candidatus Gracilibacteria bacterium]
MLTSLSLLAFGCVYFVIGILLFIINIVAFEIVTPYNLKNEIFVSQNKSVGYLIRGQLIGQGIMIGSLIYFLGMTYDHTFTWSKLLDSTYSIMAFGLFGVFLFQMTLFILSKIMSLNKEIIADNNESLGKIIEGFLIALSIIISISLYSY